MAGRKKNPVQTAATRNALIEKSYELFSRKSIEAVTMSEVAKASGFGEITLYRYFPSKPRLVVAAAVWKWSEILEVNEKRNKSLDLESMTAAERFAIYLDSFIELYRKEKDLLRFNQFFNIYIHSENIGPDIMKPYRDMIEVLSSGFHKLYLKAEEDHSLLTDEPEEEMFSTTIHLMLAAVTRYAIGLIYIPENGFSPRGNCRK